MRSWLRRWRGSPPSAARRAMPWSRPVPLPASSSTATCSATGRPARSVAPRSTPTPGASPRWPAYWRNWPSVSASWIWSGSSSTIRIFRGRASGSSWRVSWSPVSSINPSWRRASSRWSSVGCNWEGMPCRGRGCPCGKARRSGPSCWLACWRRGRLWSRISWPGSGNCSRPSRGSKDCWGCATS
ncbi:hypothetical protein D3C77_440480 [compost metagenome]